MFAGRALKANYEIVESESDRLVIRDIGPWSQFASVTNAAEEVVAELHKSGTLGDRRLLYYDSCGRLDEIVHAGREFIDFRFIEKN